ncbi:endospore germination permease [Heliobacillus mobilis]|uniref:Endospore germination permease n=1 Tax=Heliobacterium mobile TaxID=28064 RepID=A0A6I3SHC4_HELMO|nr:endospore germination permease [Heliobacterium mobile]MTV48192.1 endospore germination permease [Heliobacterium mobile]
MATGSDHAINRESKIGVYEAVCWVAMMIVPKVMLTSPRDALEAVGPSAWLMTSVSAGTALLAFFLIYILAKRFPKDDLVSILEKTCGRFLGGLISLIMASLFFANGALVSREFVDMLKIFALPMSPPGFLLALFGIGVATLLYLGFETVSRTTSLFAAPLLVGLLAIILLAIPLYRPSFLTPIFGYGIDKTILVGISRSSAYGDIVALAFISPTLQGVNHLRKSGIISLLISGLLLALAFVSMSLLSPYFVAMENTVPMLLVARSIEFGRFFQRFESIFMLIWAISSLLLVTVNLYLASNIYCKVFRIHDDRVMVLPMTVIFITIADFPRDMMVLTSNYIHGLRTYGWIIYFGTPLLALLLAWIRRKQG